jgi:transposase
MKQQQRQRYPTDLTGAQWAVVERAMPGELWNAIFYQAKNGGTWRALPHDFPPWAVVWQQKTGPSRGSCRLLKPAHLTNSELSRNNRYSV